ncbi:four helix bundle protein [Clostridium sp. ZS2-4]|uniref:four helix bundle protein n=1 Tax=Clostridium sp. ZS2-4 TaxID=2987703 RepID=UPI00227B8B10|nr:four helix bundle protein [Clostridium sp. ZS2-4]MCY6353959.1 four helix bundle protein [Clostridium sp. ZS2-4]
MRFEENSIVYKKSFSFSLSIIDTYKYLTNEKKEYIMSKQLLRCGTSIGANISESFNSQSKKDLISKLYISLKEAGETEYWIKLLVASNILDKNLGTSLLQPLKEIIKILSTIIKNNKTQIS